MECVCPDALWEVGGLCLERTGNFERFSQEELCVAFGGSVEVEGDGQVCKGLDEGGTFCILGSVDAFPCRGLFKSLRFCNLIGRPVLNPFVCGGVCLEGTARGMGCVQ